MLRGRRIGAMRIALLAMGVIILSCGAALAGTVCLDAVGFCNDLKFQYDTTGIPGLYEINGWEYGCGYTERLIDGTLQVSGSTATFNFTKGGVISGDAFDATYVGTINLSTNSGPYVFTQSGAGVGSGSGTHNVVPCPLAAAESGDADENN